MDVFKKIWAFFLSIIAAITAFFSPVKPVEPVVTTEPVTTEIVQPAEKVNIIFMIGDGMGFNHLDMAETCRSESLFVKTIELSGSVITVSENSSVTDSAAAATALACGVKTHNGCVGVYSDDLNWDYSRPQSLTELAISCGMKTGILTTDKPYGATPAGFSAHTSSRDNYDDIIAQQLSSGIDLMWFALSDSRLDGADAQEKGYTYVTNTEEMSALLPGTKTVGEFKQSTMWKGVESSVYGDNPSLSELTSKAVEILDNDDSGFFLMVEGAHIDKNSHDGNVLDTALAVSEFDNAVEAAVRFAEEDGHTLVIVTADHETGGLSLEDDVFFFSTSSHTGANVPLFVYGADGFITDGEIIDNTVLSDRIAAFFTQKEFPVSVATVK